MSAFLTKTLVNLKKDTASSAIPGTVNADSVAVYTSGLISKNSVSIISRVKELFNEIRDSNLINDGTKANPVYATMNVNGGAIVIETAFIGMAAGDVRVGIGSEIRPFGSAILERAVKEATDFGNENNNLVNG